MIRLIATDLDGTLFYPKRKIGVISRKNNKFLREYIQEGNHVVLVSGRNINAVEMIEKKVKAPFDMVACNGAIIYKDNQVIEQTPLNIDDVKELYEKHKYDEDILSWTFMTNKYPLVIVPVGINRFVKFCLQIAMFFQFRYMEKHIIGKKYLDRIFSDPEVKIYKVQVICGVGKAGSLRAKQKMNDFLDAYGTKFEFFWSNQSIEVMNVGVNKANALKKIVDVLELRKDEVAVVGDSGNDLPLFESFENSFVMAHAPSEVKEKAKIEIKGVYCLKDYIGEKENKK